MRRSEETTYCSGFFFRSYTASERPSADKNPATPAKIATKVGKLRKGMTALAEYFFTSCEAQYRCHLYSESVQYCSVVVLDKDDARCDVALCFCCDKPHTL